MKQIKKSLQLLKYVFFDMCGGWRVVVKKNILAILLAGGLVFASCDILTQLTSQVASVANLANCKFDLKNVSNVSVAGVNVKNLTSGNLSATDIVKLVAAYQSKQVPLSMDLNINVKNPTQQQASMTAMDWILAIDGSDVANGASNRTYTIKPSTTTTVPLGVNTDLGQLFSSKGLDALKNFASSFTSDGTSSKIGLRIRPSMNVGTTQVPFPNYINLEKRTGR